VKDSGQEAAGSRQRSAGSKQQAEGIGQRAAISCQPSASWERRLASHVLTAAGSPEAFQKFWSVRYHA